MNVSVQHVVGTDSVSPSFSENLLGHSCPKHLDYLCQMSKTIFIFSVTISQGVTLTTVA